MIGISAKLEIIVGSLSILTGLLYVLGVFGQTESIVDTWGLLAVILGGIFVFLGVKKDKVTNILEMVLVLFLVLIQTPAIFLWFTFSGSSISDGTPPSTFEAHWLIATPHMVIVLIGIVLIVSLFKRKTG